MSGFSGGEVCHNGCTSKYLPLIGGGTSRALSMSGSVSTVMSQAVRDEQGISSCYAILVMYLKET